MTQNSQGAATELDDEAFEAFIRARRPVSPIWSMGGLDGYLTALIISRGLSTRVSGSRTVTGPDALNLPMETTEHRAVQTIVAEYNQSSASLAETPKDHRPRFTKIDDQTFDPFAWDLYFPIGNKVRAQALAARPWRSCRHWGISSRPSASSARQNGTRPTSGCRCRRRSARQDPSLFYAEAGKAKVLTDSRKPIRCPGNRGLFVTLTTDPNG